MNNTMELSTPETIKTPENRETYLQMQITTNAPWISWDDFYKELNPA